MRHLFFTEEWALTYDHFVAHRSTACVTLLLCAVGLLAISVKPPVCRAGEARVARSASSTAGNGATGIATLDIEVWRAYLLTEPDVGDEVVHPARGEVMFFHAAWRVNGFGGPVNIALRARLDGVPFCATSFEGSGGESGIVWCIDGWPATAGTHTLQWDFDYTDAVAETDETNNSTAITFTTGATPTRTPNASATRTPSATPRPTSTATQVPTAPPTSTATSAPPSPTPPGPPTPTATPVRSRTSTTTQLPTATSVPTTTFPPATATRGSAGLRRFFARGDSDCSTNLSAADVIGEVLALNGNSACNNDDCDRDGQLTSADVDCAVGCLFGECPVPPHAPQVTAVTPESAPGISPFSMVRVTGANFGPAQRLKRVTVGGEEARVAQFVIPDTLLVIIPDIAPGPTALVVRDGEVAGVPFPITVAAPTPIGASDTLDGLLDLVDAVVARFAALDLDAGYDPNGPIVRAGLERFGQVLEEERAMLAADPNFTAEAQQRLDALVDASGMPELLRDLLAELEAAAGGGPGSGASATTIQLLAPPLGQATRVIGALAKTAGVALSLPEMIAIGTGLAVAGGIVVVALDAEALTPFIFDVRFADAGSISRTLPTAAGTAIVTGGRLDALTTSLRIQTAFGDWTGGGESCGSGCLSFPLPDVPGFCGGVLFSLTRGPLESNGFPIGIQPELLSLDASVAEPGDRIRGEVRGMTPCSSFTAFAGIRNRSESNSVVLLDSIWVRVPRTLPPGSYGVREVVESISSKESEPLEVLRLIEALEVRCFPRFLAMPPGDPRRATCEVTGIGDGSFPDFPDGTVIDWQSSDSTVASVSAPPPIGVFVVDVDAVGVGETQMSAQAFVTSDTGELRRFLAQSRESVSLSVVDVTPPHAVRLTTQSSLTVEPGTSVEVRVEAEDNALVTRLRLRAVGDAAVLPEPEYVCLRFEARCTHTFRIDFRATAVAPAMVTVFADAFDGGGAMATSAPLVFRIGRAAGRISGRVLNQAGGSPIAGATVQLLDQDGGVLASTSSAADGAFAFDDVDAGTVRVRAARTDFRAAEETVLVEDGRTTQVTLRLSRSTGTAGLNGTVEDPIARINGQDNYSVANATVTVIDPTRKVVGTDLTDADGAYAITGLPAGEVVIRVEKVGFAPASVRRVLGANLGNLEIIDLFPINDACDSDFTRFEFLSGHIGIGGTGVNFGEADFDSPLGQKLIRPDASGVCLSGDATAPTIGWDPERIHNCCGGSSGFVFVYDVEIQEGSGPTQTTSLWKISAVDRHPPGEIQPPVLYGDQPPGTRVSGTAPALRSDGTVYRALVAGSSWEVYFRVAP